MAAIMCEHHSNKSAVTYQDVAAYFSEEEWKCLHDWQKELYSKVMNEVHQALISLGPLIATTVYTLRTKEKKEGCTLDDQDSDTRDSTGSNKKHHTFDIDKYLGPDHVCSSNDFVEHHSVDEEESGNNCIIDQADVTPVATPRSKEEVETCFMDNQNPHTSEILNSSEGQSIITFRIKEEVETCSECSQDSDRMEIVNSSEVGWLTNALLAASPGLESRASLSANECVICNSAEKLKALGMNEEVFPAMQERHDNAKDAICMFKKKVATKCSDSGTVTKQQNCRETVKCLEWKQARKASSRKNYVLPVSEKPIQYGSEMWSEDYQGLAEVKTNQREISFGNPSGSNLNPKTPVLESTGTYKAYTIDKVNTKRIAFTCPPDTFPGYKTSINQKAIHVRQQLRHGQDNRFKCADCEKSFPWKSHLIRHQATHYVAKPFQCTVCQRCYARNDSLISHIRKHSGEKPYQCTICMQDFKHKRNLSIHKAMHIGN